MSAHAAASSARTRTVKRPRVGAHIVGPTGVERVVSVQGNGASVLVADEIGRVWSRERAADGAWMLAD